MFTSKQIDYVLTSVQKAGLNVILYTQQGDVVFLDLVDDDADAHVEDNFIYKWSDRFNSWTLIRIKSIVELKVVQPL